MLLQVSQVLESSATEIDSGARQWTVRAPWGNGAKSENGEQTEGEGERGAWKLQCNPLSLAPASKSDAAQWALFLTPGEVEDLWPDM